MGWKLEIGSIERQTKWGMLYSPTTQEELDGRVYVMRLNGVSTDLVQDATDQLLYHERIKSGFLRIRKLSNDGTAGWEITDTKGTKYKFGTATATRIQGTVGSLGTEIFKWCLERVEDRDGNYMTITYQSDDTTNQQYLSQIDYAGNGATAPTNQVKFYLEDRTDAPDMYTSNFKITTAKRLATIDISANGQRVRAYALKYTQAASTATSVLISVQPYEKGALLNGWLIVSGETLPLITFGYPPTNMDGAFGSLQITAHSSTGYATGWGWQLADVNGDGKADIVGS
jgi:hypothetical protein